MIYTVLNIEEDLDYGCEEKAEDQPVMAVVTLRSEAGEESARKFRTGSFMKERLSREMK